MANPLNDPKSINIDISGGNLKAPGKPSLNGNVGISWKTHDEGGQSVGYSVEGISAEIGKRDGESCSAKFLEPARGAANFHTVSVRAQDSWGSVSPLSLPLVIERDNRAINPTWIKVEAKGKLLSQLGSSGVWVDDKSVYILSESSGKAYKSDLRGESPRDFTVGLKEPCAIYGFGDFIYISERAGRVSKYSLDGVKQDWQLNAAGGVADIYVDSSGFYVACADGAVSHFNLQGGSQPEWNTGKIFNGPTSVTSDGCWLYVPEGGAVFKLSRDGKVHEVFLGGFKDIRGVAWDGSYLYVSDRGNKAILRYTQDGIQYEWLYPENKTLLGNVFVAGGRIYSCNEKGVDVIFQDFRGEEVHVVKLSITNNTGLPCAGLLNSGGADHWLDEPAKGLAIPVAESRTLGLILQAPREGGFVKKIEFDITKAEILSIAATSENGALAFTSLNPTYTTKSTVTKTEKIDDITLVHVNVSAVLTNPSPPPPVLMIYSATTKGWIDLTVNSKTVSRAKESDKFMSYTHENGVDVTDMWIESEGEKWGNGYKWNKSNGYEFYGVLGGGRRGKEIYAYYVDSGHKELWADMGAKKMNLRGRILFSCISDTAELRRICEKYVK